MKNLVLLISLLFASLVYSNNSCSIEEFLKSLPKTEICKSDTPTTNLVSTADGYSDGSHIFYKLNGGVDGTRIKNFRLRTSTYKTFTGNMGLYFYNGEYFLIESIIEDNGCRLKLILRAHPKNWVEHKFDYGVRKPNEDIVMVSSWTFDSLHITYDLYNLFDKGHGKINAVAKVLSDSNQYFHLVSDDGIEIQFYDHNVYGTSSVRKPFVDYFSPLFLSSKDYKLR